VQTREDRPRRFLGWDTVVAGAGLQFVQVALFFYPFGVYVVAWQEEFGWSGAATSAGFATVTLLTGTLGMLVGRVIERFGVRSVVAGGLTTLALGLAALSTVSTLAGFYGAMAVVGLGVVASGFLAINAAILPWFAARRSTALALMSLGLTVGALAVPLVAGAVVDLGWRTTLRLSALATLVAMLPIAILTRREPAAYGQRPDGQRPDEPGPDGAEPTVHGPHGASPDAEAPPIAPRLPRAAPTFTLGQALRSRAFWLLSGGHATGLIMTNGVSVHLVPHLVAGDGFSIRSAAAVVTIVTVLAGVAQFAAGPIGDRFDLRRIAVVSMLAHGGAVALLAWSSHPGAVYAFAAVHGIAWGIRGPMMALTFSDYFGPRHFASIMGASMAVFMVGQLVGPVLTGALADAYGAYRIPFTLLGGMAALAALLFHVARPPTPRDLG
jgi:MFS family permease